MTAWTAMVADSTGGTVEDILFNSTNSQGENNRTTNSTAMLLTTTTSAKNNGPTWPVCAERPDLLLLLT